MYNWCVREGVADGNLIAKWKKQGLYFIFKKYFKLIFLKDTRTCAACVAFKRATPISARAASAACPRASWKRAKSSSASTVAAVVVAVEPT